MVCGGVFEDGLVIGLFLLLKGPEMRGSFVPAVLEWGYIDAWMVLEVVLCLCVWGRCGVCCSNMFCLVHLSCSCKVWWMVV